jgi:hypothetical protein
LTEEVVRLAHCPVMVVKAPTAVAAGTQQEATV